MTRKFDPFKWKNLDVTQTHEARRGVLQIMCSREAALFIEAANPETGEVVSLVASVGTSHHLECAYPFEFRLVPTVDGADLTASVYAPDPTAIRATGEVFTNIDRKPHESGTVMEVRRAVREERLRMKADIDDMRRATMEMKRVQHARTAAMRAERERHEQQPAEPQPAPAPAAPSEGAAE